jgi:hypothetical protein
MQGDEMLASRTANLANSTCAGNRTRSAGGDREKGKGDEQVVQERSFVDDPGGRGSLLFDFLCKRFLVLKGDMRE